MLTYLRDTLHTFRLQARYRRIVQERVLDLIESYSSHHVAEDPGHWTLLGNSTTLNESDRADARSRARALVLENPHARNILRLLEIYVVGPGLHLSHMPAQSSQDDTRLARTADRLWNQFLHHNRPHFSYNEHARRAWRDGETFLRKFSLPHWPPTVRFIDPETIAPTTTYPDSQGILTDPDDVETPLAYLHVDPATGELLELVPAADLIHTRVAADSNQKRGTTIFAPLLHTLSCFERWLDTELQARKLQASIVLWRKVQGSPAQAAALADSAQAGVTSDPAGSLRRERYRPGTILTTSHGTDLQFLQPNTNFGDAVPLGRMLLLSLAAGAGLPEFMLTADASNANFSSTMVAEGPAVKLFQSQQEFFAAEFRNLWTWVMNEAVRLRLLPDDFFDRIDPQWAFPKLVTRDRPRERLADARLVDARILSRAEIARRDGVDPNTMQFEIQKESTPPEPRIESLQASHHELHE